MTALALVPPRSTYLPMTHLLIPYWILVKAGRHLSSKSTTTIPFPLHMEVKPQVVLPGSPPHTTRWSSRSRNKLHPSPSRWRLLHLMSLCWLNKDSPSPLCPVTFTNTSQSGGMMAIPSNRRWTRSCRTIHFVSAASQVVPTWRQETCKMWGKTIS